MNNAIFLTRGEIHIHSEKSLSIHLKPEDKRLKEISKLLSLKKLMIVTVDPTLDKFYKLYKGNWYLIPTLEYTGSADYQGYTHFSFEYKFSDNDYYWEKSGIRTLKDKEIETFRKTQKVDLHEDRNFHD
jgi:hypothetical protein